MNDNENKGIVSYLTDLLDLSFSIAGLAVMGLILAFFAYRLPAIWHWISNP